MSRFVVPALLALFVGSPAAAQMNQSGTIEVPLRVQGGKMVVPVETGDGDRLEFIVSTNATTILSETGALRSGGQGLTLAGVAVPTDHAETYSDADLTVGGRVFDGMIGSNTLNQFDVLIDVPGSRLILKQIGREVEWEGMTLSDPVPLRIYHGTVISLDVEVNGMAYPAMMEIGTTSVIVNESVRSETGITGNTASAFTIGGTTYSDMPVHVEDLPVFLRFQPDGGGFVLVGAPIALDCAISISYVHQEMRTCVR